MGKKDIYGALELLAGALEDCALTEARRTDFASQSGAISWARNHPETDFVGALVQVSEVVEPATGGVLAGVSLYMGLKNAERTLAGLKESLQMLQEQAEAFVEALKEKESELGECGFQLPRRVAMRTMPPAAGWKGVWARLEIVMADENYTGSEEQDGFFTLDDELLLTATGQKFLARG